jgi:hypothetical protein
MKWTLNFKSCRSYPKPINPSLNQTLNHIWWTRKTKIPAGISAYSHRHVDPNCHTFLPRYFSSLPLSLSRTARIGEGKRACPVGRAEANGRGQEGNVGCRRLDLMTSAAARARICFMPIQLDVGLNVVHQFLLAARSPNHCCVNGAGKASAWGSCARLFCWSNNY